MSQKSMKNRKRFSYSARKTSKRNLIGSTGRGGRSL